jgi:ADP-ribose pyrophosphatase YjhB (NUDIX family)
MSDPYQHQRLLISAKAILHRNGRVLLVKNARSEWDLPGGKLQKGEDLEKCLERELQEELHLSIGTSQIIGAFKHHYYDDIIVIVYDCGSPSEPEFVNAMNDEPGIALFFRLYA